MNSKLKGNKYKVPENIINFISNIITKITDSNIVGLKRAKNLVSQKVVTYGQLKRIIHDLNKVDKLKEPTRYNLYGGDLMKQWAINFLNSERNLVKNKKEITKNVNSFSGLDNLRKNAFNKTHTKRDNIKMTSKHSSIEGLLNEEINKIKKLINY
jgi:hypothetical protein